MTFRLPLPPPSVFIQLEKCLKGAQSFHSSRRMRHTKIFFLSFPSFFSPEEKPLTKDKKRLLKNKPQRDSDEDIVNDHFPPPQDMFFPWNKTAGKEGVLFFLNDHSFAQRYVLHLKQSLQGGAGLFFFSLYPKHTNPVNMFGPDRPAAKGACAFDCSLAFVIFFSFTTLAVITFLIRVTTRAWRAHAFPRVLEK